MPTIKDDIYNFLLLSVAVCLAERKICLPENYKNFVSNIYRNLKCSSRSCSIMLVITE